MTRGLINLTLLLFSYETKFLTSCYSKDNICQMQAFLSERKSNVFRGQTSLCSASVSAGAIYWDAWGTVGHNWCEKPLSAPADKDELKYMWFIPTRRIPQPLVKNMWSVLTEAGTGLASQGPVSHCVKSSRINTAKQPGSVSLVIPIFNILLGLDYGFKQKKKKTTQQLNSYF